jgi:CubicO group peptidase (beta-lactamase class C family)
MAHQVTGWTEIDNRITKARTDPAKASRRPHRLSLQRGAGRRTRFCTKASWTGIRLVLVAVLACAGCTPTFNPDIVCDTKGCISQTQFNNNISTELKNNAVGYVFYVGKPGVAVMGGLARTATDPPSIAMLGNLPINIASVSKTLTAVAVLQALASHTPKLTIDDKINPFLYPDWQQKEGPLINTLTFKNLLTHTSGFRLDCGGNNTGYQQLLNQITTGVNKAQMTPSYNNCNFAIFREILPIMYGYSIPPACLPASPLGICVDNSPARAQASALAYIDIMNKHVFQPIGIPPAQCKPPAPGSYNTGESPALGYPFPAGSAHGTNFGDWTLYCGGGGWVLTAANLRDIVADLAGGNTLLTDPEKSQMFTDWLGWDNQARSPKNPANSDCPGLYPCKNGSLPSPGWPGGVWTYLGIFKCTVPVTVVVNSPINFQAGYTALGVSPSSGNDIVDLVGQAYSKAITTTTAPSNAPTCPH